MPMDINYERIVSEFSEEEKRILYGYMNILFEYKTKGDWEKEAEAKLKQSAKELKEFEERALKKIEVKKANPACSFCKKPAKSVEKLFNKNEHLNICNECVTSCYEQL